MGEPKKKNILPVVGLILCAVLLIALGSYAYWQLTRKQTNKNVVGTVCLNIDLENESGDIDLAGSYPMSEEEALATNPYRFTITNNCSDDVNYAIALESLFAEIGESSNYLDYRYIRVKIDDEESKTYEELTGIESDDGVRETKEITHHNLAGDDDVTHEIWIWIDEDTPLQNEDESYNTERYFYGKVKVVAGQGISDDITELENGTKYNFTFKDEDVLARNVTLLSENTYNHMAFFFIDEDGLLSIVGLRKEENVIQLAIRDITGEEYYFVHLIGNNIDDDQIYDRWYYHENHQDIYAIPGTIANANIVRTVSDFPVDMQEDFDEVGLLISSNFSDIKLLFDIEKYVYVEPEPVEPEPVEPPTIGIVGDGDLDTFGTEVQIGDEHFYVLGDDTTNQNNVRLLAKYNLLVGNTYYQDENVTGEECETNNGNWNNNKCSYYISYNSNTPGYNRQSSIAIGRNYRSSSAPYYAVTIFANSDYWVNDGSLKSEYALQNNQVTPYIYYDNSKNIDSQNIVGTYVENYKNILENDYKITVIDARLLMAEELLEFGCTYDPNEGRAYCFDAPSWAFNSSYWLGSLLPGNLSLILSAYSYNDNNDIYADNKYNYIGTGVRPVISVSKSIFN